MVSEWGITPKQSIEAECRRRGRAQLIAGCIHILEGRSDDDDLLLALAAPAVLTVLDGREGGRNGCWPKVWAARGLLRAWDDSASKVVVEAALDESWRVREMVAKVVATHEIDSAVPAMVVLLKDPVARVRRAAERALLKLSA
ncbi:MAG TPA: HEAT repeat domain-containing protein [Acidimicrobiales bacterium]